MTAIADLAKLEDRERAAVQRIEIYVSPSVREASEPRPGARKPKQLALGADLTPREATALHGAWTYRFGMPRRSGTAKYLHLVMWDGDPSETRARGAEAREQGARDPGWQKRAQTEDGARAAIVDLLADETPRTWNCICVQLYGANASGFCGTPAEAALWALVAEREIVWACEEGCVFFTLARFLWDVQR